MRFLSPAIRPCLGCHELSSLMKRDKKNLLEVLRLESLPFEWRIADHSNQDVLNLYVSNVTREGRDCDMDPPMISEALESLESNSPFSRLYMHRRGLKHGVPYEE